MEYLFNTHPAHLSLDVSTNNTSGCAFYGRLGLEIEKVYPSGKDEMEFATFTTPPGFVYKPRVSKEVSELAVENKEQFSASTRSSF